MSSQTTKPPETAAQVEEDEKEPNLRKRIGLLAGPVLFAVMLVMPSPEGLAPEAWRTAATGVLMAVWWITEALPIAATALVPLVALPLLGIRPIGEAAPPYANPLIFLFMGGFVIAIAMQTWRLHRRLALGIVRAVGTQPHSIIIGFIIAAASLSMWVSNTATALMMLPIALSIVDLVRERLDAEGRPAPRHFNLVLVLSIAYACNIGGMGTLIGTPPNALLAGFMLETYGFEIGFVQWMAVGLPLVVIALPLMYLILTLVFPIRLETLPGGGELIEREWRRLGSMTKAERRVGWVFGLTALLWMTRPLLADVVPGLSDAGIAMTAALVLFLIPSGTKSGSMLLDWDDVQALPWGVLILFGGGLSLAAAISETGLATWIGQGVEAFGTWPVLLVLTGVVALIVLLTEITSNTATTAAFLPILASVAVGIGQSPLLLVVPAALASSCAFMLPVATPPNAIVYGSGFLSIPDMSRAGVWLNLLFIGLVTAAAYLLLPLLFDVAVGVVPTWAAP